MPQDRLLILDDEPAIGHTMQAIAETAGMDVHYTADPAEFFRDVDQWNPTHIAIDLVMPKMDGVQVMVELAQRGCTARLIVSSGVSQRILDAAGRSAAEHGLDIAGVLPKPFSPQALRSLLGCESAPDRKGKNGINAVAPGAPLKRSRISSEELRHALERRELVAFYQPKINCASGALAGFEALVRWDHPEHGLIAPDCFIPVAEDSGLIDDLTDMMLELTLAWFSANFPESGVALPAKPGTPAGTTPQMAINLSAKTLADEGFVERISALCARQGVAPSRLIFELTETSAMEDPVASLGLLTRLRMKEFQLSIDDFGTGYSSMLQLARLPFSEIKIDKSFVMTAGQSSESRSVIKSIVDLGHSLDLQTTAEGVEDAETLKYLTEIGCTQAQGYHIARPMPGDATLEWISRRYTRTG